MGNGAHTGSGKAVSAKEVEEAFVGLLKAAERDLAEHKVVVLEDIRELKRLQEKIAGGDGGDRSKALVFSCFSPLLDFWRRLAAEVLNKAVTKGVLKTETARAKLAARIRCGAFGGYEHLIRSTEVHVPGSLRACARPHAPGEMGQRLLQEIRRSRKMAAALGAAFRKRQGHLPLRAQSPTAQGVELV
jgi:hypothetical protein